MTTAHTLSKPRVDLTKPVQTREGRPARILCTDIRNEQFPVAVAITWPNGVETTALYTAEGEFNPGGVDQRDLINVPPKTLRVIYQNVFKSGFGGRDYLNAQLAKAASSGFPDCLGVAKLTIYDNGSFTVEKVEESNE